MPSSSIVHPLDEEYVRRNNQEITTKRKPRRKKCLDLKPLRNDSTRICRKNNEMLGQNLKMLYKTEEEEIIVKMLMKKTHKTEKTVCNTLH